MTYLVIRDGEVGTLLAGLMNLIATVQKLDAEDSNTLIHMSGQLAEGVGAAPSFASKADYLHSLKDLEKRLTEQMNNPLPELERSQWERVLDAVVHDHRYNNENQMILKLMKLRDASSYSTDEGPRQ